MRGATRLLSVSSCSVMYFNPRSSCEERLMASSVSSEFRVFQSTLLMRGATVRPPTVTMRTLFQSTLLMRGATAPNISARTTSGDFNPRSSCEERLDGILCQLRVQRISIHAPHARSDHDIGNGYTTKIISIHAPHARSDATKSIIRKRPCKFQSTLLMRGATFRVLPARRS